MVLHVDAERLAKMSDLQSAGDAHVVFRIGVHQITAAAEDECSLRLKATHMFADQERRIERALEEQARAESVQSAEYRDWDRTFHLEIAKASGNAALTLLVGTLWDYRRKPMFEKIEELLMGPDRLYKTPAEHRRIFESIAAGDRAAARNAMKAHLDAVLRAFSRGLGTN